MVQRRFWQQKIWTALDRKPVLWLSGVRRIVTRDTDFHRFPFLETVDPLT